MSRPCFRGTRKGTREPGANPGRSRRCNLGLSFKERRTYASQATARRQCGWEGEAIIRESQNTCLEALRTPTG